MEATKKTLQFTTFYLDDRLYGLDVMRVQEVTLLLPLTVVRLAPPYVKGLMNLRGQIATAIGLRELFSLPVAAKSDSMMTAVCRCDGHLLSLLVDRIGDVIEVNASDLEAPPETLDESVRRFMLGVIRTDAGILSVVEIDKILESLNASEAPRVESQKTFIQSKEIA